MLNDLRYAIRLLLRSPAVTSAAVVTLALGIGANTAIYSVLQAVWLDAVPFPDAKRLAMVHSAGELSSEYAVSWANFADWRRENRSFVDLAAIEASVAQLRDSGGGQANCRQSHFSFAVRASGDRTPPGPPSICGGRSRGRPFRSSARLRILAS
jgi:hypothetical protein